MGLFDKLRDSFAGDAKPKNFEVTFGKDKMGMTLAAGPNQEAMVTRVADGGAAAKAQIRANDIVKSVNGNPSPSYDALIAVIGSLDRPLSLGFFRPGSDGAGAGEGQGAGPFQRAQEAARRKMEDMKGSPQPPQMTAEEKAERREATLKAAEGRTKHWDKRLNKGRQASQAKAVSTEVVENQFEESDNAETRRMVELAKKQEARTAASMGYNPYEARLMGNTAARAAISGGGATGGGAPLVSPPPPDRRPSPTPTGGQRLGGAAGSTGVAEAAAAARKEEEEKWRCEDAEVAEEAATNIREALDTVFEQGPAVSLVAVQTMLKMMKNMAAKPHEDKFKKIRLANPGFQRKVGGIDGGLEVMIAAGFSLETDGEEPILQHGPCDPAPLRLRVAIQKLDQVEARLNN